MRRRLRDRPEGPEEDRLFDLMRDRAVHGLDDEDMRELNRLASRHVDVDLECYDRAAAALDIVFANRRCSPMPIELRRSLAATARRTIHSARDAAPPRSSPEASGSIPYRGRIRPWIAWSGWVAAASVITIVMLGRLGGPSVPGASVGPQTIRSAVDGARDHVVLPWRPTDDADGRMVSGEVHWSATLQQGYMHFLGLPTNDPARKQYQLWIFDEPRGTDHPVDGGVFDVTGADVFVPIDAKIHVSRPTMFAVTLEAPGGVVVSRREHVVALAQL